MKRVEIIAYCAEDDCDDDIDRAVQDLRVHLNPMLVIVEKRDVTPDVVEELLADRSSG